MKKLSTLFAALLFMGSMMAQEFDTWSVVGAKAIMNGTTDWAIGEAANDMATEDGVTYTLTVTGKTLEEGTTYEYKYAKGHAWTVSIPQSGNLSLTVAETAVYDIVYTVNVSDKSHSAVATKAGEAGEISHVYSVAGSSAALFGASWNEKATATEMTLGEDGIYSWTKENVELAAGTIEYKVVVDHGWGETYPSSNAKLVIAEAATYNVLFTFNPDNKAVNATATKVGGEPGPGPEPEPTYNYYLAGSMNEPAWSSVGLDGDSVVLNLEAGEHGFKVQLAEGVWDGALGYDKVNAECSSKGYYTNKDRNVMFELTEAGQVKIKVVEGKICVTGAFTYHEPEPTYNYYLAGSMNEWGSVGMDGDSIVLHLEAGDYAFKIQLEPGNWETAKGFYYVNLSCSGWGVGYDKDGNACFTLEEAGDVTIRVLSDGTICATGAFVPVLEPSYDHYLAGTMTEWESVGMDGDSIVLHLEAGEHQFKIQYIKGVWDSALGYADVDAECSSEGYYTNEDGNVCFKLTEAGDVLVKFVNHRICVTGAFYVYVPVRETFTFHAGITADKTPTFFVMTSLGEGDPAAEIIKMTLGEGDVYTAEIDKASQSLYVVRCAPDAESVQWGVNVWNGSGWVAYATEYWFAGWNAENDWIMDLSTTEPAVPVRKTLTFHAGDITEADPTFFVMTSAVEGATDETSNQTETIKMTVVKDDIYTAEVLDDTKSMYIVRCASEAEAIIWGTNVWNGSGWVAFAPEVWFSGWNAENSWIFELSTTEPINTNINNIETAKVVKTIENGKLVIIREGVRYNVVGVRF